MITKNDKICFLGDSITEGVGTSKCYWQYISEQTGAEVHSFGVNGAETLGVFGQIERLDREVGDDFNILCILIGTNDYNSGVEIGEFYTEHKENVPINSDPSGNFTEYATVRKRDFIFDTATFKGRLNLLFSKLREKYTDKRIIMLTPLHRAYAYFGGNNIQPNELYANKSGVFFDSYIKAEREAADIWSIELIDLYRDSGLFPLYDNYAENYFNNKDFDRLHPNADGHKRIAAAFLNKA